MTDYANITDCETPLITAINLHISEIIPTLADNVKVSNKISK